MKIGNYEVHPLCELFPWMDDKTFVALKEDISQYGQRDTIKIFKGLLLDGKNRLRALTDLKMEPLIEHLPEETNIIAYIKSVGLCRRDLRADQRIDIAARICDYDLEQEGKKEKLEALKRDDKKRELLRIKKINDIAKEANSNPKTVSKYMKIKETAKEGSKKAEEELKQIQAAKTSILQAHKNIFPSPTLQKPLESTLEEVKTELYAVKTEKVSLQNRFKRVIEVLKKHNVWDIVKSELYPILERIPSLEPTIKELREAELA